MSEVGAEAAVAPPAANYLTESWSIRSWLLTIDHKRIAILYMLSITGFFFVGGLAALVMRIELLTPASDVVSRETYNRLFTLHGAVMVWFFLIPSIPTVLGNFLIPLMIGTDDLVFPRLNLLSWYLFMAGGLVALGAIVAGGADTGWTFYTPYSSLYAGSSVVVLIIGVFIAGFSSILTGLNFIVTVHTRRCPGMTWRRLPLFVWSIYATSLILVLATPVLAVTVGLVAAERLWGVGIFNPALGGDPLLFQHLFWFYSHPAVYIMVLPAMAVMSEIIPAFSRKEIFGYSAVAAASLAIAILGFLVWGHHMFVSGQSTYASVSFSLLSYAVAIPSAIKVFNWSMTMRKGTIRLKTPMLYALGFLGLFTVGGLTGLFLAALAVDVHVHDTYFVIAHFHFIMVGGSVSCYLGALHYWWPKMTGRMYPEGWGVAAALLLFFGFVLTFIPQFIVGYLGMLRRQPQYPAQWQMLNVLSSAGSSILGAGYLLPLVYLLSSLRRKPDAGPNPWQATGLEWTTPSPPPTHNFPAPPRVTEKPYQYPPPEAAGAEAKA
ncbi:MAG TPA: cbb3-type cytochrome c oxidase subunit I [Polyangia bacterium]|jgi:cytochrome c oxidase subunit 1